MSANLGAYGAILRVPHVAPLLAASVLARVPIGINALAILLYVREVTGSYAVAGAVSGALGLGVGGSAPLLARLVDHLGARRVLAPLAVAHAAGLGLLVALAELGAPAAALVAAGLLTGVAFPPLGGVLRALWPVLLARSPALLAPAFALDSVVIELIFVLGPLIVAVLVGLVGPAAALVVSAASVLAGTLAFLAAPLLAGRPDRGTAEASGLLGALRSRGLRTLMLASFPVGFCFGTVEVGLPAFAEAEGERELSGVLLALWAAGSAAGGLLYGVAPRRRSLPAVHLRIALALPLAYLPLAFAPSPLLMALLLVPAGAVIAPLLASRNELVGAVAPVGAETEAYSWPVTALVGGIAFGAASAGAVVEAADWSTALLVGVAAACVGAAVAFGRRGSLVGVGAETAH